MKNGEARQFRRRAWRLLPFKELGRSHENAFASANLLNLERLIRIKLFTDSNCNVDRLFDEIDAAIGDNYLHAKHRVLSEKFRQAARNEAMQPQGAADSDKTSWLRARAKGDLLNGAGFFNRSARVFEYLLTNFGHIEAAGRALNQADPQLLLE